MLSIVSWRKATKHTHHLSCFPSPWVPCFQWNLHTLAHSELLELALVFPVVMYGCESWTVKKAECRRIVAFELWCWKRLWCWEGLGAGWEGDDRGWDGWKASLTRWTWVWVNSGSWWWTGRPGVLQFMGSQRVGHDWAAELNWTELNEQKERERRMRRRRKKPKPTVSLLA